MKNFLIKNILASILVLLMSSCSPNINRFTVVPQEICGNSNPKISFDVSGSYSLEERRSGNGNPESIVYELYVEEGGKIIDSSSQLLLRWTTNPYRLMDFDTDTLGTDSLIGSNKIGDSTYEKGILVDSIISRSVRPLLLSHAGRSLVIDANSSSQVFRGLDPQGQWIARAAYLNGEHRGDPETLHFQITLTLTCPK